MKKNIMTEKKFRLLRIFNTVIKMALAGLVTSLIAKLLKLDYWITAGILAVLSTQLTKRDAFIIAGRRIVDTLLGLVLAFVFFYLFGSNFWIFIIIIFVFALLSFLLKIPEGIVPVLVLISHVLEANSLAFNIFLNEFLIMLIAIVVVLILDLIYPQLKDKEFLFYANKIDNLLKEHIIVISKFLKAEISKEEANADYNQLVKIFNETYEQTILLDKDVLFSKSGLYISYLQMRQEQIKHINHIYKHGLKLSINHPNTAKIALFLEELSLDIGFIDKASLQLEKLNNFFLYFKTTDLPKTREEFETRAMLHQMLNEVQYFLEAKIVFHQAYPNFYN